MEGRYEEGEREGAWTWWYENGNKSQFGAFMGGQRNSPFTYWYANGMKSQEVTFVNGERNGLEITWYEGEQGKNSRERRFRDGKQYGGDAWKVLAEN